VALGASVLRVHRYKGFGLGSQYTFGRLSACMRVWTCVREEGKLKCGMKRDH
jgi:hypothetical protein